MKNISRRSFLKTGAVAAAGLTIVPGSVLGKSFGYTAPSDKLNIAGIGVGGMAVDANVIIFARIREEIASGKTVRTSIETGFKKALSAILDGNITTLIAAAVLGIKGSGTVKGFA